LRPILETRRTVTGTPHSLPCPRCGELLIVVVGQPHPNEDAVEANRKVIDRRDVCPNESAHGRVHDREFVLS
jgi:hypothetical protein